MRIVQPEEHGKNQIFARKMLTFPKQQMRIDPRKQNLQKDEILLEERDEKKRKK